MEASSGTTMMGKRQREKSPVSDSPSDVEDLESSDEGEMKMDFKDLKGVVPSQFAVPKNGDSTSCMSLSSKSKIKKKEQYKNQVIVDNFGTFEYDKDPEAYKRARK